MFSKRMSLELKIVVLGLCIYSIHCQQGGQGSRPNTQGHHPPRGGAPHPPSPGNHPPPPGHHPPTNYRQHNARPGKTKQLHVVKLSKPTSKPTTSKFYEATPAPKYMDNNESAIPTDVPEEKEIGEDPTTSADGLTQRTESPHGPDPIEQRDPARTHMAPPRGGNAPPPPPPRYSIGAHSRAHHPSAPHPPATQIPPPKPTTRKDPIVHARTTTEPPKPTEAGEVEYENEGGTTTVANRGGGGGRGGGRRNQRGGPPPPGGYYDYYYQDPWSNNYNYNNYNNHNNYNRGFDSLFHKMMLFGSMDLLGFYCDA